MFRHELETFLSNLLKQAYIYFSCFKDEFVALENTQCVVLNQAQRAKISDHQVLG